MNLHFYCFEIKIVLNNINFFNFMKTKPSSKQNEFYHTVFIEIYIFFFKDLTYILKNQNFKFVYPKKNQINSHVLDFLPASKKKIYKNTI